MRGVPGALRDGDAVGVPQRRIWGMYLAQCPALGLLQLPLPLGIPQRCLQLPDATLGTAGGGVSHLVLAPIGLYRVIEKKAQVLLVPRCPYRLHKSAGGPTASLSQYNSSQGPYRSRSIFGFL